jgi:hypothetical protein
VSPVNNPHFQDPPPPSAGLAREMSKCIGSVVGCVLGAGVTACRAPCSRVGVVACVVCFILVLGDMGIP